MLARDDVKGRDKITCVLRMFIGDQLIGELEFVRSAFNDSL